MRSSKNRSRSKGNRNRSVGNIVNRVFDSSGPEGKVRGTPQQIIDKYNQLARDAQLGNDRVAAENFQQHAEHYLRLLSEAQREQEARREQQQQQQQQNNQGGQQRRDQNDTQRDGGQQDGGQDTGGRSGAQDDGRALDTVGGAAGEGDSTLVETPENASKPRRNRSRRPRKTEGGEDGAQGGDEAPKAGGDDPSREAAE